MTFVTKCVKSPGISNSASGIKFLYSMALSTEVMWFSMSVDYTNKLIINNLNALLNAANLPALCRMAHWILTDRARVEVTTRPTTPPVDSTYRIVVILCETHGLRNYSRSANNTNENVTAAINRTPMVSAHTAKHLVVEMNANQAAVWTSCRK